MQQSVDLVAAQFPEQEMALEYLPLFLVGRTGHDSPRQGATTPRTGDVRAIVLALEQTRRLAHARPPRLPGAMINWLVVNRLAQSARFGFRTCPAAGGGRTVARPTHATARCQCPAGRLLARAQPTRTPV